MAANSFIRVFIKSSLRNWVPDVLYQWLQATAMAWDIRSGGWTEPELDLIPYAVRNGETALDIGANYGLYSYHLARAVGLKGLVYAFEPVPFTNQTFSRVATLLRFRNVKLFRKGCSDETKTLVFRIPVQSSGAIAAGLACISARNDSHEGWETQVRWDQTTEVECEVVRLDDHLPELRELSLIKCDVEGAELLAFRGARQLIDEHHPSVICEINPWYLTGFGIQLHELTDFFLTRDYELFRYGEIGSQPRLQPISLDDVVEDNYLFLHRSRRDRFSALLDAR